MLLYFYRGEVATISTIAERLRKAMENSNISQTELAKRTGIGKSSISTYLAGSYEPKQKNIYRMAQVLDVNEAWLMGYDAPMERDSRSTQLLSSNIIPLPPNMTPLPQMREWPVLGATACGKPLHRELLDETVMAPDDIKADVVFRCIGDSMINARIFDGDAVFVRLQPEVENGQIAVVRIGDEYTLKRVYHFEDCVELRAENPIYKPTILRGKDLDPNNFEIIGLAASFLSAIV